MKLLAESARRDKQSEALTANIARARWGSVVGVPGSVGDRRDKDLEGEKEEDEGRYEEI